MELDLFAGYAIPLGSATLDVGLTWYMYPSGADTTDFAEPLPNPPLSRGGNSAALDIE